MYEKEGTTMAKQTRLEEEADIYQKRTKQKELEKLGNMTAKEKAAYLKQYYLKSAIILTFSVIFLIVALVSIFSPKPETKLSVAVINDSLLEPTLESFTTDFMNYANLDSEKEDVTIQHNLYMSKDAMDQSSAVTLQKISTMTLTGSLDVIIATKDTFEQLTDSGYFIDLSDQLPTDLYSTYADDLFLAKSSEDTTPKAYGISLANSKKYKDLSEFDENYIIGIIAVSPHKNEAQSFIEYLFLK